jgi:hypothetical protein
MTLIRSLLSWKNLNKTQLQEEAFIEPGCGSIGGVGGVSENDRV